MTLRSNLQRVETKKCLWLILVSVAITRVCSILPVVMIHPFPLYDMDISLQSYVYFFCVHLSIILIWLAFFLCDDDLSGLFYKFTIIEILSLIDYILIYEHPWFHLGNYGVEFTDVKILLYSYFIILWKRPTGY